MKEYKPNPNIKLTNWVAPRNPRSMVYDVFKQSAPIDMKKYENVGQVEYHDSTESVINKMIAENEAKSGRKLSNEEVKSSISLNGINDDRKDKGEKLTIGTK